MRIYASKASKIMSLLFSLYGEGVAVTLRCLFLTPSAQAWAMKYLLLCNLYYREMFLLTWMLSWILSLQLSWVLGKGSDFWKESRPEEGEYNSKEALDLRLEKEIWNSSSDIRKQNLGQLEDGPAS